MLKITRLADYSVLILCCFNNKNRKVLSARKIKNITGLNIATVNKLLSLLVKSKILLSMRGVNGGYSPVKKLQDLSVREIIEAVEGPVAITNCMDTRYGKCDLINTCCTKNAWSAVNKEVIKTLDSIKIIDINHDNSINFLSA